MWRRGTKTVHRYYSGVGLQVGLFRVRISAICGPVAQKQYTTIWYLKYIMPCVASVCARNVGQSQAGCFVVNMRHLQIDTREQGGGGAVAQTICVIYTIIMYNFSCRAFFARKVLLIGFQRKRGGFSMWWGWLHDDCFLRRCGFGGRGGGLL